jgi:hypothetical protein
MEQLKVGTNDLSYVAKKKVVAAVASVSSMEAFLTMGLALELEVPTTMMTNIHGQKVGGGSTGTLAWMTDWRRWRPIST